jgi:outer membrane protein TolC
MKYPFLLFFVGLCFVKMANAQQMLSLEDAIAAALKNNYDILLTRNDSISYALDRSYAYGAFLPRLNATATRTFNTNAQKQELSNGTKRDTTGIRSNNLNAAVTLSWTLFDGFKMFATREKLIEFERLGTLAVKDQVINSVAQVVNNYYNIVRQKQQLKAIEEQISIDEERVKLADRKLSVGLGSKPELLQAKVDLNADKAQQITQQTLIAQLREQLNRLIGFQTHAMYEVTDSIPLNTALQYGSLQNNLDNSSTSLLLAKKNIDIAELVVKERRADLWPILQFNSAYNFSRTENKAVINSFTPLFNQNRGLNYGLGLTVPILNGFNTRRLIRQGQLDVQYQQLILQNQRSLVDVGLSNAFKDYELQKRLLTLEEDNISLAKECPSSHRCRASSPACPPSALRRSSTSPTARRRRPAPNCSTPCAARRVVAASVARVPGSRWPPRRCSSWSPPSPCRSPSPDRPLIASRWRSRPSSTSPCPPRRCSPRSSGARASSSTARTSRSPATTMRPRAVGRTRSSSSTGTAGARRSPAGGPRRVPRRDSRPEAHSASTTSRRSRSAP